MSKDSFFAGEEFEAYINYTNRINSEQWEKDMNHKLNTDDYVPGDYDPGKKSLEKLKNKSESLEFQLDI